jgi:hypothetical protein
MVGFLPRIEAELDAAYQSRWNPGKCEARFVWQADLGPRSLAMNDDTLEQALESQVTADARDEVAKSIGAYRVDDGPYCTERDCWEYMEDGHTFRVYMQSYHNARTIHVCEHEESATPSQSPPASGGCIVACTIIVVILITLTEN